jgi:hypothetical protein
LASEASKPSGKSLTKDCLGQAIGNLSVRQSYMVKRNALQGTLPNQWRQLLKLITLPLRRPPKAIKASLHDALPNVGRRVLETGDFDCCQGPLDSPHRRHYPHTSVQRQIAPPFREVSCVLLIFTRWRNGIAESCGDSS